MQTLIAGGVPRRRKIKRPLLGTDPYVVRTYCASQLYTNLFNEVGTCVGRLQMVGPCAVAGVGGSGAEHIDLSRGGPEVRSAEIW